MSQDEQQKIREKYYAEAIRYMDNAKETLKKGGKENDVYHDRKYVSTACRTAYKGVLMALDTYFQLKGVNMPKKGRKSIEFYTDNVSKLDKKLLVPLDTVYHILHLDGYYDGIQDARVIKRGFDVAYNIIDKIKPLN
ncbi:hypothetical protein FACS189421_12540 [Bacteroidia bacterium]|nr:hypothetical protein FACS189421_12540 [Bacteroidia bacterium]GHT03983.1 hypothetical protein FACS189423_05980 [Bacteroidia bacterium]GHT51615.1 hypothetical protein FACS189440_20860 [Bacteroidia bacterium]